MRLLSSERGMFLLDVTLVFAERQLHVRSVTIRAGGGLLNLAAAATLSFSLQAEGAAVRLNVRGGAVRATEGTLSAKSMDGKAAIVERGFKCTGNVLCTVDLDLPEGHQWLISASGRGFWPSPAATSPGGNIDLWPTGTIRGEVRLLRGETAPSEIGARFFPSPNSGSPPDFPSEGLVLCPIVEGRFECEVPASTLDVRLRVKGHVSLYRWSQNVLPGASLDVGNIALRRGASLVGRVVSVDRSAPKAGACTVRLEAPAGASPKRGADMDLPTTTVDGRGFFQLEVLPPGSWVVVAEQEGFAPARRGVNVLEGMEGNLNEPLVLARPVRLEVTLLPPQAPDGKPWQVEIIEEKAAGGVQTVATTSASLAGFWSRDRVSSGTRLLLRVRTGGGQAWWADGSAFDVVGPIHKRTLEVGLEAVRGSVRLGDEPLAANLAFGGREENVSISLRSGAEGAFSGALPRLGKWHVVVTSEKPSVRRELDVELRRGVDGHGTVEIQLQDRAIVGEIVDESGKRVERSILSITASSRREFSQERVEGGAFRLTGFEAGGYILSAESPDRVSEKVRVEVAPDGTSSFVTIVARPKATVRLRFVNESGSPVAGASVEILTTTVFPGLSTLSRRADSDGRVSFSTHPGVSQQCFIATSPGLSTSLFSVAPDPEEREVVLASGGGTLNIDRPTPRDGQGSLIWRGQCFLSPELLKMIAGGDGIRFPGMAPGQYRLCFHLLAAPAQSPVCSEGFLASYGALPLKVSASNP